MSGEFRASAGVVREISGFCAKSGHLDNFSSTKRWRVIVFIAMGVSSKRVVAGGLLTFLTLVLVAFFANNAATAANHGQLVTEEPRRDVPVVLDGSVFAHEQVGDRIFVGGDFQDVQRPDGTIIDQPYIFAYDINTGLLDESFRPVLNNSVHALELNPAEDALYVGGRFWRWEQTAGAQAAFPERVAKLDVNGVIDPSFVGDASAIVRGLAVTSSKVYLAGDFTVVGGQPRLGFAAIDASSAAVDPGFVMDVGTSFNDGQLARQIVATSDGTTVFGLHFSDTINGQTRPAVVKVEVSTPTATLADWELDWFGQAGENHCLWAMRDIAISPDDSFIVIGGQGSDRPPNCDSVLQYPTGGTGVIPFNWSARMYSSVFSLAVSDTAVYVGGHFCGAPKNPAPPGGIAHAVVVGEYADECDVNNPVALPGERIVNPSELFPNDAVFRKQLAALDPANGQALDWDPGSNAAVGTFDLTVIDRGLLAGMDSDRYGDNILTGRSGFFDFGGPADTEAPTVGITSPADGVIVGSVSSLTGTATDDFTVASVTVRLKNLTTDQFLQADGATFATAQAEAPVTLTATGLGQFDWNVAIENPLPPARYEVRAFSADVVGQTAPVAVHSFIVSGSQTCTVELNGAGVPRITWNDFDHVSSVSIRRNDTFLSTAAPVNDFYVDTTETGGDTDGYVVRWRPNGTNVDVPCSIPATPDTIPPVVSFATALSQSPGVVDLDGGVTDDVSGVQVVRVRIRNVQTGEYWNGTVWQAGWAWNIAVLNGDGTWTLPSVDLTQVADYDVLLWAWDTAGNRAAPPITPAATVTVA